MSSVAGRDSIIAYGMMIQLAETLSKQVYQGQMPGYLFRSLQNGLRLLLGLFNAFIAIVLSVLLVELRGISTNRSEAVGWAGVALVNSVGLSSNFAQ